MQNLEFGLGELVVAHRPIRGAEINGTGQKLANPAPGANRLVVDLNVRVSRVVDVKPLGIDWVRESRSRCVEQHGALCPGGNCQCRKKESNKQGSFHGRGIILLDYPFGMVTITLHSQDYEMNAPTAPSEGARSAASGGRSDRAPMVGESRVRCFRRRSPRHQNSLDLGSSGNPNRPVESGRSGE